MPWNKSLSSFTDEIRKTYDEDVKKLAFYALKRLKDETPVGNPDTWKNPNSAPRGYRGGTLKKSFNLDRTKDGYLIGSDIIYAERIWADGHSRRLAEGAIDQLVADLSIQ